jgi:hypothetical protein
MGVKNVQAATNNGTRTLENPIEIKLPASIDCSEMKENL